MPRIWIDNQEVDVSEGSTILDAARALGMDVPALCHRTGCSPSTSCMCCVVRVNGSPNLVPSCATVAVEGMRVESETEEVRAGRRGALELLLSDHVGDCMGPCQCICPAGMDIPTMIRQIHAGDLPAAIETVKAHIALPAVLGRICPAPCEKGCRRGQADAPVSIMLLKRRAADADLAGEAPYLPDRLPATGKRVAIVGAGPAGLAAAYYLLQQGHACVLFDQREAPGGMLRYGVGEQELPRDVLDGEIAVIERLGAEFRLGVRVGHDPSVADLRRDFDAVFLAVGRLADGDAERLGIEAVKGKVRVRGGTLATAVEGVFAGGDAVRAQRMTVRAVADGRSAAIAIGRHLAGGPVTGEAEAFNSRIGRLREGEIGRFLAGACGSARIEPEAPGSGLSAAAAVAEAARCLHCDCRKPLDCKLRIYAGRYGARTSRFRDERRDFLQHADHPAVLYEPLKCIQCGLCIQIAARHGEKLGLTFIGRGSDVRVAVPFGEGLAQGLAVAAAECARACPTGALAARDSGTARADAVD
ncbi:MAG TPA: FAD-dependent oxidoreductase [Phycisphaerae bacterium]|nr:FAD-dependent oxidoreductase [Phycisphaerae bacterium]